MKVGVKFVDVESELRKKLSAYIIAEWPDVALETSLDVRAMLAIRDDGGRTPLTNVLPVVSDELFVDDLSIQGILLQLNAKLGKLSASDVGAKRQEQSIPRTALTRRDFLFGNLRRAVQYSETPIFLTARCDAQFGCDLCIRACPHTALRRETGVIKVNDEICTRCGICSNICPTAALQMPTFSRDAFLGLLYGIDKFPAPKKTLVISDDADAVPIIDGMVLERVKHIGYVDVWHLIFAATSSLGAVVIHTSGDSLGLDNTRRIVETLQKAFVDDVPKLTFIKGSERRNLEEIIDAHEAAQPRVQRGLKRTVVWEDYTTALETLLRENAAAVQLRLTDLTVSDDCTLCGSCVKLCPHKALDLEGIQLFLDDQKCTGCGFCARACPENAIKLVPLGDVSEMKRHVIFQDRVINCARCGKPYMSAGFLRNVSRTLDASPKTLNYCPECKQKMVKERIDKYTKKGEN